MTKKEKRGHGAGQITRISKEKYEWRVWVKYPNGQRRRVYGVANSKRNADDAITAARKEAEKGRYPEAKSLTIADMVEAHMAAKADEWSYRSKRHNKAIYDRHMHQQLGGMVAVGVKPQDLRIYYQQLTRQGLGWSSQHQLHSLLCGSYKQAIGDGLLHDNPTLHVKPIRPRGCLHADRSS